MKKLFFAAVMAVCAQASMAQASMGLANHLSVGVGVGTTGVSIEAAIPLTRFAAVRAGVDIMPGISYKSSIDVDKNNLPADYKTYLNAYAAHNKDYASLQNYDIKDVDIKGKIKNTTGHILIDAYPFIHSSFHVTVGAAFGGKEFIQVNNTNDGLLAVAAWNNMVNEYYNHTFDIPGGLPFTPKKIGFELDNDNFLSPDKQGNAEINLSVKSFRPYVGIGFGRAVPGKKRVNVSFDMGCYFWGKPTLNWKGDKEVCINQTKNGDLKDVLDIAEKVICYPVLTFKVNGRIF